MTRADANFLAKFDELNVFVPALIPLPSDEAVERFNDLLRECYRYGCEDAGEQLDIAPKLSELLMLSAVFFSYGDDIPIQDKFQEYLDSIKGTDRRIEASAENELTRLLDGEMHRTFATGSLDTAYQTPKNRGAVTKKWVTMLDSRVREQHRYLHGVTTPLDGKFYTADGDSAYAPGMFASARNNANCRCKLEYSTAR